MQATQLPSIEFLAKSSQPGKQTATNSSSESFGSLLTAKTSPRQGSSHQNTTAALDPADDGNAQHLLLSANPAAASQAIVPGNEQVQSTINPKTVVPRQLVAGGKNGVFSLVQGTAIEANSSGLRAKEHIDFIAPLTGKNQPAVLSSQTNKMLQDMTTADTLDGPANKNQQQGVSHSQAVLNALNSSDIKVTSTPESFSARPYTLVAENGAINSFKVGEVSPPAAAGEKGVVIEKWSATFSPTSNGNTPAAMVSASVSDKNQAQPTMPLQENAQKTAIQNNQGQLITVYQSSNAEELATNMASAGRVQTSDQSGIRQDANSNYIHSHLPTHTLKAGSSTAGQQAENDNSQKKGETGPQPQQSVKPAAAINNTSIFSQTGESSTGEIITGNTTPQPTSPLSPSASPLMMRLPSGVAVPESAVMDQVVAHLSNNRKLESGSMRIRLHPQELGELRMEIEVKHENIKAHITTQNPQAQEALDRYLPKLRDALEQQGLTLSEVEITVDASEQFEGQRFQEKMERQQLAKNFRSSSNDQAAISKSDQINDNRLINQQHDHRLSVVA